MNKRSFLLLSVSTSAVLKHAARADFTSTLDNKTFPTLNRELSEFLQTSKELRQFMKKRGDDAQMNRRIAGEIERKALTSFESLAGKGSRRHQFYLGRVYKELFWLTQVDAYDKLAIKWLKAAEDQGHPGAVERQITRLPNSSNQEIRSQYLKAIKLGSVSALAACSGANSMTLQSKDWMKEGPVINIPEDACVGHWSDVFANWMLIYHFLIQWDAKNAYFRLSLPNTRLLEVISGMSHPSDHYGEELGMNILREIVDKSAARASDMDKDFYPEELYDVVWNKLFRFSL